MEGTGSYAHYDTKSVSFSYRSFEQEQKRQVLLSHHKNYVDKHSDDEVGDNENTKLLQKQKGTYKEATSGRKVFIMVACLYLHFTTAGLISALGVIYVDLIQVFNSPHSEAALVQSLNMGMTIGGGVIFTAVIQKYGTGLPVMISSLVAGSAYVASSFATNVPTLIALIGVVAGSAMSINFLSAFITVGWTFQGNRKTVLAILMLGSTAGQMSFPYISQYLIDFFRWNGSFMVLSGFIFNCIPCGLLLHKSRQYLHMTKSSNTSLWTSFIGCAKDYLFVLFLVISFFFSGTAPVEMWFIADLTVLKGFDRSIGTTLLSLLGVFGFIGRLIGAVFLKVFKRVDALVHTSYAFALWGVGHYLVGYFDTLWGLILAVVVRGLSAGLSIATIPGSQIELRGVEQYPQTVAICNLIGGVAQIIGGLLGGVTIDITGGYDFIFTFSAVTFVVCGVLTLVVWILRRRQRKKEPMMSSDYQPISEEIRVEKEPLIAKYHIRHG